MFAPDTFRGSRALRLLAGFTLMGCALSTTACDDDDDIISPPILEGVTTFKDNSFNFGALRTFAMPDTVVHVIPIAGTPIAVSRQFDHVALDQVRANLLARGFVEVDPGTTMPDFVVLVAATASNQYHPFVEEDDWYGYWGFYDWTWYAPGFTSDWHVLYPWQSQVQFVEYQRGTLIVDLIPTLTVNPLDRTLTSKWAGVATAALDASIVSGTIAAAVDQMFALSPYLAPAATAPMARLTPEMGTRSFTDVLLGR